MREIIFRGRFVDSGDWVYGVPIWDESNPEPRRMMVANIERYPHGNNWEIFPESLAQYTGLKDCNGTMIFEGDIVKYIYANRDGVILWDEYSCRFVFKSKNGKEPLFLGGKEFEVIGNIHENPELLKDAR